MRVCEILLPETVAVELAASSRQDAIQQLVASLAAHRAVVAEAAVNDVLARERAGATTIRLGRHVVAVPHARTDACKQLVMALGLSRGGVPWPGGPGDRANAIILILGPSQTQALYLRVLARIARLFENEALLESLLACSSPRQVVERLAAEEAPLGDIAAGKDMPTFCVLGAGHGGMAMAAHLAITGCQVNMFNRNPARIEPVRARGGIDVDGEVVGFAPIHTASTDPAEAMDNCDVLMVVVPATAHRDIASLVAPHIKDGQILVLNPGRTGGAIEVARTIRQNNPHAQPYIAEAQTLLYASRATNPGQVHIFGIKNSVPLATLPTYHITDVLPVIRKALPQFVPGDNVLKTSLDNIGAVFHPAITILNAARIEDTHGDFQYYVEGVTPSVAAVLEAIDAERVAVATALGIRALTAREWLYLAYDAAGKRLYDAMMANAGYRGITAPGAIDHRYISEDVPASLVPIASIGRMLGVPTPTIEAIIHLGSIMHGVDYWAIGRTVSRLGLEGMSPKEIRFLVMGAEPAGPATPPVRALEPTE